MASDVNTAHLSIGGREFIYSYPNPDAAKVNKRANAIHTNHTWMPMEECKAKAFNDLLREIRIDTMKKVNKFVTKFFEADNNKVDVGITQRLADPIEIQKLISQCPITLTQVGGPRDVLPIKDPKDMVEMSEGELSNRSISRAVLNQVPTYLISKINAQLDRDQSLGVWEPVDVKLSAPDRTKRFGEQMHDIALQMSGGGVPNSMESQELFALNRFNKTFVGPNRELQGFTFITRPHLNLAAENIAPNPMFQSMLHGATDSFPHAARMWMDPVLCNAMAVTKRSPLVDYKSPFFTPLCNRLISCNGWPDLNVGTETSEGGFFSENQTVAVGGDRLARGCEFTLTFKELQGGLISSIFDWWCRYMIYIGDGSMHQRPFNIEHNLMGYTVSIYRFLLDHTGRNITRWAKATGCFPRIAPIGTPFNVNQNEFVVTAGNEVSVMFQVHKPDYNNPIVLREFNKLVSRYNGYDDTKRGGYREIAGHIANNYEGFPWIEAYDGHISLVWLKRLSSNGYNPSGRLLPGQK